MSMISGRYRVGLALFLLCSSFGWLRAQDTPAVPAPFLESSGPAVIGGVWQARLRAADEAIKMGFSSVAERIYREALESGELSEAWRQEAELALATALLDSGRASEAEEVLRGYNGERTARFQLRRALVSLGLERQAEASVALAGLPVEELSSSDRGWYFYARGLASDAQGQFAEAQAFYGQALEAAVSEPQRARLMLGRERSRLLFGQATEQQAAELRRRVEEYQGRSTGFQFAQQYAVVLNFLGRRSEAEAVLRRQLELVPAEERQLQDRLRLLLGMIAGSENAGGRAALRQLLFQGSDLPMQRFALEMLAGAARDGFRDEFRRDLDQLISRDPPHPLFNELLLLRAQVALADRSYSQVQEDAERLLARLPGTELRVHALSLLVSMAWDLNRFRTAASYISQLRGEIPAGPERARLAVLLAEAYFRAGDYQNAAGIYGLALDENPPGVAPGFLMFQQVLSEIRAGRLQQAQVLLDTLGERQEFDPLNRWQAEWNLIRELEVRGGTEQAYDRVVRLLGEKGAKALPIELRVRMAWQQARLAFWVGRPAEAVQLADSLILALGSSELRELSESLRQGLASTSLLLKAQAYLDPALGDPERGLSLLEQVRTDYRGTHAAIYSFIVQASYLASRNQSVEAQQLLIRLADDYPDNEYAPFALFQAAVNAEVRALDDQYKQAYNILERLVSGFPQNEFVFYARLKQGDLLRKLDQFPAAQQIYETLLNNYSQHRDILLAEMALADCLLAQGNRDRSRFESGMARLEKLMDLPHAPVDLRVEAGYKYGNALARSQAIPQAQKVYWFVVSEFLVKEGGSQAELGLGGRYWVSRALLELGDMAEREARLEEARRAYSLLLEYGLPGDSIARDRLARFQATASSAL